MNEIQELREKVNDLEAQLEDQSKVKATRRGVLGLLGGAGVVGAMSGGAAASGLDGSQNENIGVGGFDLNVSEDYHVAGNWYLGPESVRPNNPSADIAVWDVSDAGAGHAMERTYWNGSSWNTVGVVTDTVSTEDLVTDEATGDMGSFSATEKFYHSIPSAATPHPSAYNPVLTASDVTDINADFVADPSWYGTDLFFEVGDGGYGRIGRATSTDGLNFEYDQIILDPGYHLALPAVFDWQGETYITGSSGNGNKKFNLWRFTDYEAGDTELVERKAFPKDLAEYVVFPFNERWWCFSEDANGDQNLLFYSDTYPELAGGTWTEHPESPLPRDPYGKGAVSGPPIVTDDAVYLSTRVTALDGYLHLTELSTSSVTGIRGAPVIGDLDMNGMTAIDPHALDSKRIDAATRIVGDGKDNSGNYQILIFEPTANPDEWAELGLGTAQTISDQSSSGYQTVNTTTGNSYYLRGGVFPDIPLINPLPDERLPAAGQVYANAELTSVSGTPFDLRLRIWDTANNRTIAEREFRITEAVDQEVHLPRRTYDFNTAPKLELQCWQNSGSSIDLVGNPQKTHYGFEI